MGVRYAVRSRECGCGGMCIRCCCLVPEVRAHGKSSPCDEVRRICLVWDCLRLRASRRSREPAVGLVGLRGRGACEALWMRSIRRPKASWRLRSWVRKRCATTVSVPSAAIREPAIRSSRLWVSGGKGRTPLVVKRSWTAVETLLTFCPPGPEERTEVHEISRSSSATARLTLIVPMYASSSHSPREPNGCRGVGAVAWESTSRTTAFLVLLAATARAWLVATDFGSISDDRHAFDHLPVLVVPRTVHSAKAAEFVVAPE
jgi:hypothetical protein